MRILIISVFFPPLNSIASLRPYSWAKYWSIAGHDVTVLTIKKPHKKGVDLHLPNPGYRLIEIPAPKLWQWQQKISGVIYTPDNDLAQKHGPIKMGIIKLAKMLFKPLCDWLILKKGCFHTCRMPEFSDLWIQPALKNVQNENPFNLVVSTAGPYNTHLVAYELKMQKMTQKWVADYRDPWIKNQHYSGLFPFNKLEKYLEKKILSEADLLTTVSNEFANTFEGVFPKEKIIPVHNGFDPIDKNKTKDIHPFSDNSKFRIVYTGTIYLDKQDPSPLFQAISEMAAETETAALLQPLEVLFVGAIPANLENLIKKHNVEKYVKFQGFVDRNTALAMQRDAHALLYLPWKDDSINGVLTGKIFEYLFSDTPIIAVGQPKIETSQQLILDAKAGTLLPDVQSIKKYLSVKIKSMKKENTNIDPAFLAQYERKNLAEKLLNEISKFEKAMA